MIRGTFFEQDEAPSHNTRNVDKLLKDIFIIGHLFNRILLQRIFTFEFFDVQFVPDYLR